MKDLGRGVFFSDFTLLNGFLNEQLIKFSGVAAGQACTVVLRGATSQMIDEAERSLHDALSVLSQTVKESRVVLGGGCSEMLMSNAVEEESRKVSGKKAIATEAFSRALRQVRFCLGGFFMRRILRK